MPLLDDPVVAVCTAIAPNPATLRVRFPFGIQLESFRNTLNSIPGVDQLLLAQLNQLNALLAPFAPIMILAAIGLSLINCIKAIPDAITSLNPNPIFDCIDELLSRLPLLAQFIPGFSYIVMLRDLILMMKRFIVELDATLLAMDALLVRQLTALDIAKLLNSAKLRAEIACAADDTRVQYAHIVATFSVLQTLLCALAIPLALLEAVLPPNARQGIKDLRCSIRILAGLLTPVPNSDVAALINALRADIAAKRALLATILQLLTALDNVLSGLIGETPDIVIEAPNCFTDCPPLS